MKKFLLLVLIGAATVYAYYWYVRGINLLIRQDEYQLPPYAIAQRLLPKEDKGKTGKSAEPVPETVFAWARGVAMTTPRVDAAYAAIGTRLYVAGGIDGFARTVATVEAFDIDGDRWVTLASLPKPLHHATAAAYGGKLFVFGGLVGLAQTPVDTLYIYDPQKDQWSKGADLPEAVGGAAAVVVDGKIHLLGGQSLGSDVDTHSIYDPEKNAWDGAPEMIAGRELHGAAAIDEKIYVFGGRQGSSLYNLDSVEVYDQARKTWDTAATMPNKRSDMVTLVRDGKVYLFGGEAPTVTFDQVDVYDPKADRWSVLPQPMPTARHGLSGAIIDGSFFLVGGGKRPGISVTDVNEVLQPADVAPPKQAAPAVNAP
ncbi:MAG TPA: kelch repeat-containing protein [Patescibacteria group bacterium]|nr:kelch repeat-containing protein [Patescibacteria group bacterium]